ncbi:MAG: peptidase M15 [Prevotella sp.]|nr:peptidase M15 [Prevotella sp.]
MHNTITQQSFAVKDPKCERLSEHFTLTEMSRSATAIRHGWKNEPTDLAVINLRLLCENVLEPLRRRFGVIRITSAFRSKRVNEAVGGAEFSQHLYGEAADIFVPNAEVGRKMFDFIRDTLPYDQLIYECRRRDNAQWLHVSYSIERQRRQCFMHYEMPETSAKARRVV